MTNENFTALSAGIEQHFKSIHKEYEQQWPDFVPFLENHLFAFTLTFKPGSASTGAGDPLHPITQFGRLYYNIAKALVGGHLARKRRQQPTTYVALDYEGSRTTGANFDGAVHLHLHCLMLVRPEHVGEFHKIMPRITSLRWAPGSIDSVFVEPFDRTKGSLYEAITYTIKGARKAEQHKEFVMKNGRAEDARNHSKDCLWEIFPSPQRASKAAAKTERRNRSKTPSRRDKSKERLQHYPPELRGPAQNKYGGQNTQHLRTYGGKFGAANPGRRLSAEECKKVELELRAKGRI